MQVDKKHTTCTLLVNASLYEQCGVYVYQHGDRWLFIVLLLKLETRQHIYVYMLPCVVWHLISLSMMVNIKQTSGEPCIVHYKSIY